MGGFDFSRYRDDGVGVWFGLVSGFGWVWGRALIEPAGEFGELSDYRVLAFCFSFSSSLLLACITVYMCLQWHERERNGVCGFVDNLHIWCLSFLLALVL